MLPKGKLTTKQVCVNDQVPWKQQYRTNMKHNLIMIYVYPTEL